jgi:hypothetical protein
MAAEVDPAPARDAVRSAPSAPTRAAAEPAFPASPLMTLSYVYKAPLTASPLRHPSGRTYALNGLCAKKAHSQSKQSFLSQPALPHARIPRNGASSQSRVDKPMYIGKTRWWNAGPCATQATLIYCNSIHY